ncbi:hypothetical protein GCM10022224_036840 [Nonomuraea antimicrobica]|uniref:Glutamine--fructose-6-phosphate aminotransferase [isomerizing] n=1 Tax=Nonomuraea antimicrobica TaxID=561173 RepID=A0ABP7BX75_9ACTN
MTHTALRAQVESLGALIRDTTWEVEDHARRTISTPDHHALQLVLLTGCGDSFFAARAAQFAWQELTGLPCFADDALTAARYRIGDLAGGRRFRPLVVAVSNSGEVARVVEAARTAQALGNFVVAVTAAADSRLAAAADKVLPVAAPPFAAAPGVRSYAMSLLGLFHLAIRSGEVRGRYTMDEAGALRRELAALADAVDQTVAEAAPVVARLAADWGDRAQLQYLGSGPSRASAGYGAAKVLEATGISARDQDVEEFAHLEYFTADTSIPVVLTTPGDGAARSRAEEVAALLEKLGRPTVTVSDQPLTGVHLPYAAGVRELWQPLLHIVPLALLAEELMRLRGEEPGRGGRDGWADSADGSTTRSSRITVPLANS